MKRSRQELRDLLRLMWGRPYYIRGLEQATERWGGLAGFGRAYEANQAHLEDLYMKGDSAFEDGVNLGFSFNCLTGTPRTLILYNATGGPHQGDYNVYAFPPGSQDEITSDENLGVVLPGWGPTTWTLDLRLEKTFKLGNGNLGVLADFNNITNNQKETNWVYNNRDDFGRVTTRQNPLSAQIGVRYRF